MGQTNFAFESVLWADDRIHNCIVKTLPSRSQMQCDDKSNAVKVPESFFVFKTPVLLRVTPFRVINDVSKKTVLGLFSTEDEATMILRDVGNYQPVYIVQHLRRHEFQKKPLRLYLPHPYQIRQPHSP